MRLNKLFLATMLALSTMMMQSCLKDQEEIFDEPSSTRLQAALDNAKEVLTSSENGWVFDYFPDRYLSYGGFLYTVKFDASKVTVGCELDPGNFETSYYRLTDDNGPTLSFDTYNSLMHFFATPSSGKYEAFDGDFEFMIMEVTDDLITLMGKRTSNIMYMRRLNEDAATLIDDVSKMSDNFFLTSADGTIGSNQVSADFDQNSRYVEFSWGESNSAGEYFLPTATGLRFIQPVEVNGSTITELSFDVNTLTYTGNDTAGNPISLSGVLPETYTFFDDFAGEYTMNYYFGALNVTLVPDNANKRYLIRGLNQNFDVAATFDKVQGCLEITSQELAVDGSNYIWLCGWSAETGYYSWSTSCGMYLIKDTKNPGTYKFVTNDYVSTPADSFMVRAFAGSVSGDTAGAPASKWYVNGSYQIPYLETLVKK